MFCSSVETASEVAVANVLCFPHVASAERSRGHAGTNTSGRQRNTQLKTPKEKTGFRAVVSDCFRKWQSEKNETKHWRERKSRNKTRDEENTDEASSTRLSLQKPVEKLSKCQFFREILHEKIN